MNPAQQIYSVPPLPTGTNNPHIPVDKVYSVPNSRTGTNVAPSGSGNIYTVPPPSGTETAPYGGTGMLQNIMSMGTESPEWQQIAQMNPVNTYNPVSNNNGVFNTNSMAQFGGNNGLTLSGILQHIMSMGSPANTNTANQSAGAVIPEWLQIARMNPGKVSSPGGSNSSTSSQYGIKF